LECEFCGAKIVACRINANFARLSLKRRRFDALADDHRAPCSNVSEPAFNATNAAAPAALNSA
jgi:hypothetical protein